MSHVPFVVPSFGSLIVVFTPVAHLSPTPWSLAVGYAVFVDQGLDQSSILFLCCVFIMAFQWAWGKLGSSHLLSNSSRTGGQKLTSPSLSES